MNTRQAEKAIKEVLRDFHLINSELHKSVAQGVITMLYTTDFLENDLVKAFIVVSKLAVDPLVTSFIVEVSIHLLDSIFPS